MLRPIKSIVREAMATTITTVSIHPDRAEELRKFRDENDLPNMDAALRELLNKRG